MKRATKTPLIFMDRDGTLIEEKDYLGDPSQVRFLPGVLLGLKRLQRSGFRLVVISNQSGVGRGILSHRQVARVQTRFLNLLKKVHIRLDGYYWCPHVPEDDCPCRKPKLGLIKQAASDLHLSWTGSFSIGDRFSDVALGQRTGGQGILVLSGYGPSALARHSGEKADFVAKNFQSAVKWILHRFKERKKI